MNDHEKDRIAAAFHQLRPDWPIKSLRTLLDRPQIADRPRRDMVVALGWVACEPATHTPARVLENGPWWRAANIESSMARRHATKAESCTRCAQVYAVEPPCCDHPSQRPTLGVPRPADFTTTPTTQEQP